MPSHRLGSLIPLAAEPPNFQILHPTLNRPSYILHVLPPASQNSPPHPSQIRRLLSKLGSAPASHPPRVSAQVRLSSIVNRKSSMVTPLRLPAAKFTFGYMMWIFLGTHVMGGCEFFSVRKNFLLVSRSRGDIISAKVYPLY